MDTIQLDLSKRNFDVSFTMLENLIEITPDELWEKKKGGIVYWQQLFHVLTGANYWMRQSSEQFLEPFSERNLYPELEKDPESNLSKNELLEYKDKVKSITTSFFEGKDDSWLYNYSEVCDKIRNIEIVYMQIRHIQYHIGHCESILRENNHKTTEWID